MKKSIFKKIGGLFLGLAMGLGVAVGVTAGNKASEVKAADITLTFSFTSCPSGWPSGSSASANTKTYTVDNNSYTFSLGANVYYNTSKYLMLKSTTYLGLPAIEGKKLTKVVAKNSSGCSKSTKVGISSTSNSATYITGGSAQTWSTTSGTYTYTLSNTDGNTMYYLYVTSANSQIISLDLTYEPVSSSPVVTSIVLSDTTFTGEINDFKTITASVKDQNGNEMSSEEVSWTSDNTDVATVSDAGLITLIGLGNATITAQSKTDSNVTNFCSVECVKYCNISFNGNGSSSTMVTLTNQTTITNIPECTMTGPTGKVFGYWAINSVNGPELTVPYDLTDDIVLYAIWVNESIKTTLKISKINAVSISDDLSNSWEGQASSTSSDQIQLESNDYFRSGPIYIDPMKQISVSVNIGGHSSKAGTIGFKVFSDSNYSNAISNEVTFQSNADKNSVNKSASLTLNTTNYRQVYFQFTAKSNRTRLYSIEISFYVTNILVESVICDNEVIVPKGSEIDFPITISPSDASNKTLVISKDPEDSLIALEENESGQYKIKANKAEKGTQCTFSIQSSNNDLTPTIVSVTVGEAVPNNNKLNRNGLLTFKAGDKIVDYLHGNKANSSNNVYFALTDNTTLYSYASSAVNESFKGKITAEISPDNVNFTEFNINTELTVQNHDGKYIKYIYTETINEQNYVLTSEPKQIDVTSGSIMNNDPVILTYGTDWTYDAKTLISCSGNTTTWSLLTGSGDTATIASIDSSTGIITIDNSKIYKLGAGKDITVRATCGATVVDKIITIVHPNPTSITITPSEDNVSGYFEIGAGGKQSFSVTVLSEYARQDVEWYTDAGDYGSITKSSGVFNAAAQKPEDVSAFHIVKVYAYIDVNANGSFDSDIDSYECCNVKIINGEIAVTNVNISTENDITYYQDNFTDEEQTIKFDSSVNDGASVSKVVWKLKDGSDSSIFKSSFTNEGSKTKTVILSGTAGAATIYATSMNEEHENVNSNEITITVYPTKATSITVDSSATSVVKKFATTHELTKADCNGLVITANFDSGRQNIPVDLSDENVSVVFGKDAGGNDAVIVKYVTPGNQEGVTASYPVTIIEKAVESVSITNGVLTEKDSFIVGNNLDLSNLVITKHYNVENDEVYERDDLNIKLTLRDGSTRTISDDSNIYTFVDSDVELVSGIQFYDNDILLMSKNLIISEEVNIIKGDKMMPGEDVEQWEKVTSAPKVDNKENWEGTYLIVYNGKLSNYAEGSFGWTGVDSTNSYSSLTLENGYVTDINTALPVEIKKIDGGYSIEIIDNDTNTNTYFNYTKNDNGFSTSTNDIAAMTLSYSDSQTHIVNSGGAHFRFNKTSGQDRFRFYKSSSYSNQQPIQLYKRVTYPGQDVLTSNQTYQDNGEALAFARKWLHRLTNNGEYYDLTSEEMLNSSLCNAVSGHQNAEFLYDSWSDMATEFASLKNESKGMLVFAITNSAGDSIQKFVALYDRILELYGSDKKINNFIELDLDLDEQNPKRNVMISHKSNILFGENSILGEASNITWIVSLLAIASIASVGGYFYFRKRKED